MEIVRAIAHDVVHGDDRFRISLVHERIDVCDVRGDAFVRVAPAPPRRAGGRRRHDTHPVGEAPHPGDGGESNAPANEIRKGNG